MVNFEKSVKVLDAVLDCIPLVSSITNASHAIYKLAYKVDSLNPVAPGLKTSIKIHSLSKRNFDCFIGFIPLFGNMFKLVELVLRTINLFNYKPFSTLGLTPDDDLIKAVCEQNVEIVDLCLANNALSDRNRAESVLIEAVCVSTTDLFSKIFNHRSDWDAKSLIKALAKCKNLDDNGVSLVFSQACERRNLQVETRFRNLLTGIACFMGNHVKKAETILSFWETHQKVLELEDVSFAAASLKNSLRGRCIDLARRVIAILPENVSFDYLKDILLEHSDLLESGDIDRIIAKSEKLNVFQINRYYSSVRSKLIRGSINQRLYQIHLGTLRKLVEAAQIPADEAGGDLSVELNRELSSLVSA